MTETTVTDLQGNNTDNNGNIKRMYHFLPDGKIPQRDDYAYDPLNRITALSECQRQTAGGAMVTNVANQSYGYDRYGNNTITGLNASGLSFSAANNRIAMAGYGYDSVGNLTTQNNQGRTYDAENRMVSAASSGFYTYDGEGRRVKRTATGQTCWYIYGIGGELLAEYLSTAMATNTPSKQYGYKGGQLLVTAEGTTLRWLVTDHLGSTRMELNSSGSVATRHDYLPFGEELYAGIRNGSNAYEPPASTTRQRFGTYERDSETGLDFAQARYYANVHGRFTSPDDFLHDTTVLDPASWNLYAYARNNPLAYIDPTGEDVYNTNLTAEQQKRLLAALRKTTGFKSISFDANNKLVIDTAAGFKKGSAAARTELLAAATSTSKIFNLKAVDGTAEAHDVAFADNKGTANSLNLATGAKTDTYDIRIDFGDFNQLKGEKKAFSIGIAILHEFEHGLHEGEPTGSDSPNGLNDPGPLERTYINPIRAQIGLSERATYVGVLRSTGKNQGYVELRFTNRGGKEKILRWQDSVVGGKRSSP